MITYTFEPEVVMVGGGTFPTHQIPLALIHYTEKVLCLDGAADICNEKGIIPWRIVGDGDSLSPDLRKKHADCIRTFPDQETNDQTKGILYLLKKGYKHIGIVGATGKREDHTLGNISLLTEYKKAGADVRIYTDHGVFIPCCGKTTFGCPTGTAVSIFGFGTKGMKAKGLAYPLRDFTALWQGTLNRSTAPSFEISCEGEYLVFLNYPS